MIHCGIIITFNIPDTLLRTFNCKTAFRFQKEDIVNFHKHLGGVTMGVNLVASSVTRSCHTTNWYIFKSSL